MPQRPGRPGRSRFLPSRWPKGRPEGTSAASGPHTRTGRLARPAPLVLASSTPRAATSSTAMAVSSRARRSRPRSHSQGSPVRFYVTGTNALNGTTWIDGGQEATGTNCINVTTTFFEVGGRTAGDPIFDGRIFNGKIAESWCSSRTSWRRAICRSNPYLAIKYGITLRMTGGTSQNYLTGTTVWSGVANPTYHNAVAGIAADSGSALDQRVSQSVTPGDQIAIAAGPFAFSVRSRRSRRRLPSTISQRSCGATTTLAPPSTWPSPKPPRRRPASRSGCRASGARRSRAAGCPRR